MGTISQACLTQCAHPLQAFCADRISTQEAKRGHLRRIKFIIDLGQQPQIHHRPTTTSTGVILQCTGFRKTELYEIEKE